MRLRGVILLATVGGNAALLAQAKPDTGTIAIVGATLIPMDRERTVPDQIVLVRDGRIVAVGPAD
jgi:hypothetical protein